MKGKKVFRIHSLLGLISGLFILIFCLTGALVVFEKELNSIENPHLHATPVGAKPMSWHKLYQEIKKQEPHLYLFSYRKVPSRPGQSLEMRIYNPKTAEYGLLYANIYTGKVLGTTYHTLFDLLITLHYTFYLKQFGELLAGIFALCFLLSIITGTYVYRKHIWKVLFFRIKLNTKNWRTITSSLHRVIGVWALLFNFILAFSGFYMMLYAFNFKSQFGSASSARPVHPPEFKINLDIITRHAEQALGGRFTYLDFPREANQPLKVYTNGNSSWIMGDMVNYIEFNLTSGKALKLFRASELSGWEKLDYALYTLHYGQYGGLFVKILYCFFGLASGILSVSGFLLYYRRTYRA